jgi:hypothetical protein
MSSLMVSRRSYQFRMYCAAITSAMPLAATARGESPYRRPDIWERWAAWPVPRVISGLLDRQPGLFIHTRTDYAVISTARSFS